MSSALRIAVIGDLFVRNELFIQGLHHAFAAFDRPPQVTTLAVDWPDDPLTHNSEVKEFVGDPAAVAQLVRDADALITHVAPVTQAVIDAGKALRVIGCCRGGPVNVNVAAASARGIPVVNAPGRNAQAVVEFTIGLILAESRGIARAHAALSNGDWRSDLYRYDRTGRELRGQTIGLVGFGAVAQALVAYLKPFGLRIIVYDPYVTAARCTALGVEQVDLPTLLAQADFVSLHARVTTETIGMMGAVEFAQMKPGAYFINTARGPLVDYAALYDALASGHLGGAGIDCFPEEPPPSDWPLLRLPNVTVTPHIGGSSKDAAQRGAEQVARDVANFFAGRPLECCVNADALTARS